MLAPTRRAWGIFPCGTRVALPAFRDAAYPEAALTTVAVVGCATALVLVIPLFRIRRARNGNAVQGATTLVAGRDLTFLAANIWALDHFCSSLGRLQSAMPDLRALCIDLRNVPVVDASSVACLHSAVRQLRRKGVRVSIQACAPAVASKLTRLGIPVEPPVWTTITRGTA